MKKILFMAVLMSNLTMASAQPCSNNQNRYSDQPIFTDNDIQENRDIKYGKALDRDGNEVVLRFNIFRPKRNTNPPKDPIANRPLVVVVHGGGFTQGAKEDNDGICKEYAKRGFVAVTIDYRLDPDISKALRCSRPQKERNYAVYRAVQDLRAALRFLVNSASIYGINTNWIFLSGNSAGGITVLTTAFTSQIEFNLIEPNVKNDLGGIDASGNQLTNPFTIKAIHNDWGSLFDEQLIQQTDAIPVISFHGLNDDIVPAYRDYPLGCDGSDGYFKYDKTSGSVPIHQHLTSLGVCSELNTKSNEGHGIYDGDDPNNPFDDNDPSKDYRVARACCFFRGVMQCFSATCNTNIWNQATTPIDCSPIATRLAGDTENANFLIYPNPATSHLNINNELSDGELEIRIFDMMGREIIAVRNSLSIDISTLVSGMYMIRIKHNDEIVSQRFVKE